jgi:hypothetical protein
VRAQDEDTKPVDGEDDEREMSDAVNKLIRLLEKRPQTDATDDSDDVDRDRDMPADASAAAALILKAYEHQLNGCPPTQSMNEGAKAILAAAKKAGWQ